MSGKQVSGPTSNGAGEVNPGIAPEKSNSYSLSDKIVVLKNMNLEKLKSEAVKNLREIKPLHVRIKEYNEAKERIFGEVSNKVRKARERFKRRKRVRKEIASATLYEGDDTRLYTKLTINGQELEGLLDSGATVSCLGKNCLSFVGKAGLDVIHFHSFIKTADGSPHRIVGKVATMVNFNKQQKPIIFYLVPSLSRELFLGVDFMRSFHLFAQIDGFSSIR